jgi:hypothetical protein
VPTLALRWTLLATVLLAACAPASPDITNDEGTSNQDDALSGSLTVGATLIATTDVNLRSGPSTSNKVLEVVPSGDSVTVVSADPQNGFYNVSHNGVAGWSSGKYYKLDPNSPPPGGGGDPGTTTVSAADILAALGSCKQLSGTTKFRKDAGGSATVPICGATSAVWWTADMDIDCDGGSGSVCQNDPDYQPDTATVDSQGNPLDASTLPYVVIPGASNGFDYKLNGLKMGSVVAVIYNGKISYGILGDVGPKGVIGEASYAMAKELGINPSPTSGGVDSGVTYVAFTGSSAVVPKKEDHAAAVGIGQQRAAQLVAGK